MNSTIEVGNLAETYRHLVVEDKKPQLDGLAERSVCGGRGIVESGVRGQKSGLPIFLRIITTA